MNDMAQDLARLAPQGAWQATAPAVPEPEVLDNLRRAGLASHAARGEARDPGPEGEAAVLRALSRLVAGSIYRLDPFHYAFRLEPGDLGGALGDLAPAQWAGALQAELDRAGVALEVRALAPAAAPAGAGMLDAAPVCLIGAWDAAVAAGVQAAGPEVQAVIHARFAAATARLTAEWITAGIAAGLPGDTAAEEAAPEVAAAQEVPPEAATAGPKEQAEPVVGAEEATEGAAPAEAGAGALERRLAALEARLDALAAGAEPGAARLAELQAMLVRLERRLDGGGDEPGSQTETGGFVFSDPTRRG